MVTEIVQAIRGDDVHLDIQQVLKVQSQAYKVEQSPSALELGQGKSTSLESRFSPRATEPKTRIVDPVLAGKLDDYRPFSPRNDSRVTMFSFSPKCLSIFDESHWNNKKAAPCGAASLT